MKNVISYCLLSAMLTVGTAQPQSNTPPWNGNLTVLGFVDMTQASYVKPWTIVTADPSGACTNAAAVQYNATDHTVFSCDGGTWTPIAGGGGGGGGAGYTTIQSGGLSVTQRAVMNFAAPFTASDNAASTRTDISLPQATSSTNGYLTSADWTNFNNKAPGGTYLNDPGGSGLVFRTTTSTTRPATSADINILLTHIYFNGAGTGIGPATFSPSSSATLHLFDSTASTGVTLLNMQEGAAQGTSPIQQIADNSGTVLAQLGFTNAFPYWLMHAPAAQTNFGSFGVDVAGEANIRMKLGLDQGAPFLAMGPGSTTFDVGLERSGVNTLQVTTGSGTAFKGNLVLNNLTISGTCTGCGSSTAITQLTGDVAAGPGPGSVASTLATVNSTPGACGDATHVCRVTTNGKGLVTAQSQVTVSGGGGGATLATQLLDFAPGTITTTAVPFGAACTTTTPCFVNLGGIQYPFTDSVTVNLTGGTASDTIYYYVDANGNRTMGYNSANTYSCSNCETAPTSGISAFPSTAFPLYQCTVTTGAFVSCADARPIIGFTSLQNGLGTRVTSTGSIKQIDVAQTARSVTGTSDSLSNNDCGAYVRYNNASTITVSMPTAGLSNQFRNGCTIEVRNNGTGNVNFNPSGSTIGGSSSFTLTTGSGQRIISDGTNYQLGAGGGGGSTFNGGTITSSLKINTGPNALVLNGSAFDAESGLILESDSTSATTNMLTLDKNITAGWTGAATHEWRTATGAWYSGVGGPSNATIPDQWYLLVPTAGIVMQVPTTGTVQFNKGITTTSIATGLRRVTANDTATLNDGTVIVAASANMTETLPASAQNGDKIVIKRVDTSGSTVTLAPNTGDNIEGNASVTLNRGTALELQYESATNTWWII